jgi:hypothetical protein
VAVEADLTTRSVSEPTTKGVLKSVLEEHYLVKAASSLHRDIRETLDKPGSRWKEFTAVATEIEASIIRAWSENKVSDRGIAVRVRSVWRRRSDHPYTPGRVGAGATRSVQYWVVQWGQGLWPVRSGEWSGSSDSTGRCSPRLLVMGSTCTGRRYNGKIIILCLLLRQEG